MLPSGKIKLCTFSSGIDAVSVETDDSTETSGSDEIPDSEESSDSDENPDFEETSVSEENPDSEETSAPKEGSEFIETSDSTEKFSVVLSADVFSLEELSTVSEEAVVPGVLLGLESHEVNTNIEIRIQHT